MKGKYTMNTNEKITLYVGLNDKDTKEQRIDTLEAVKIATNIITANTGGGTLYNAKGIYTHENGVIVIENTLRIELYNCKPEPLKTIITTLKATLNQESIIKETQLVTTEFC